MSQTLHQKRLEELLLSFGKKIWKRGWAREMDENEDKMTAREKDRERQREDSFYHTDS